MNSGFCSGQFIVLVYPLQASTQPIVAGVIIIRDITGRDGPAGIASHVWSCPRHQWAAPEMSDHAQLPVQDPAPTGTYVSYVEIASLASTTTTIRPVANI
jgi:hypothetical protein